MGGIQQIKHERSASQNLAGMAQVCAEDFGSGRCVDIHCHCLASVDDGPATMAQALALCRRLVDDGLTDVIATPHQLGRFSDCNQASQIREAVIVLNEQLQSRDIPLNILPGGDVRVDERICRLLEKDEILTLADAGKHILLELPHEVFIDIEPLIVELGSLGIQVIVSHPERHCAFAKQPQILPKWIEHSTHLQITAGSLLGEFGQLAERAAWHFLRSGWASLVATDAHGLDSRRPCMKAAFKHICTKLGDRIARLVCIENPLRVLKGEDLRTIDSVIAGMRIDETVSENY